MSPWNRHQFCVEISGSLGIQVYFEMRQGSNLTTCSVFAAIWDKMFNWYVFFEGNVHYVVAEYDSNVMERKFRILGFCFFDDDVEISWFDIFLNVRFEVSESLDQIARTYNEASGDSLARDKRILGDALEYGFFELVNPSLTSGLEAVELARKCMRMIVDPSMYHFSFNLKKKR